MTCLVAMITLVLATPDLSRPDRKPLVRVKRAPVLVVGHGFAVWEHADGSVEMFCPRTVYSGVFIGGPRQNWWPDGVKRGPKQ